MAGVKEVTIRVQLGATLMIDGETWIKPSVSADVKFDGMPTEEDLLARWEWLWRNQVNPQADDLFKAISERVRTSVSAPVVTELPQGASYEV